MENKTIEGKDLLPLGSVVYLHEGNKKLLIVSRGLIVKNGEGYVFFDYGGVPYPEGLMDDKMAYFQKEGISKVVFEGFHDLDDEATIEKIHTYIEQHPEIPKGDVKKMLGELKRD